MHLPEEEVFGEVEQQVVMQKEARLLRDALSPGA